MFLSVYYVNELFINTPQYLNYLLLFDTFKCVFFILKLCFQSFFSNWIAKVRAFFIIKNFLKVFFIFFLFKCFYTISLLIICLFSNAFLLKRRKDRTPFYSVQTFLKVFSENYFI